MQPPRDVSWDITANIHRKLKWLPFMESRTGKEPRRFRADTPGQHRDQGSVAAPADHGQEVQGRGRAGRFQAGLRGLHQLPPPGRAVARARTRSARPARRHAGTSKRPRLTLGRCRRPSLLPVHERLARRHVGLSLVLASEPGRAVGTLDWRRHLQERKWPCPA